jgi:hypothetical protein
LLALRDALLAQAGGTDDQALAPATGEAVAGKPGRARRKRASAAAA